MFEFGVFNSMEREDLYAELLFNRKQWGEIWLYDGQAEIVIFCDTGKDIVFNYDGFLETIQNAKKRLFEVEGIPT